MKSYLPVSFGRSIGHSETNRFTVLSASLMLLVVALPVQSNTAASAAFFMKVADSVERRPMYPAAPLRQRQVNPVSSSRMSSLASDPVAAQGPSGNVLQAMTSSATSVENAPKGSASEEALFTVVVDQEAGLSAAVPGVLGTNVPRRGKSADSATKQSYLPNFERRPDNDRGHIGAQGIDQLSVFTGSESGSDSENGMFSAVTEAARLGAVGRGVTALTTTAESAVEPVQAPATFADVEPASGGASSPGEPVRKRMYKQAPWKDVSSAVESSRSSLDPRRLEKVSMTVDPDTVWTERSAQKNARSFAPSGPESRFDSGPVFNHRSPNIDKGFDRDLSGEPARVMHMAR